MPKKVHKKAYWPNWYPATHDQPGTPLQFMNICRYYARGKVKDKSPILVESWEKVTCRWCMDCKEMDDGLNKKERHKLYLVKNE